MNRAGFTLPEVLVVMVLLAIGIIPLSMIQSRARQEVQETDRFTQAVAVGQRQLEWAKGQGFGHAIPDSGETGHVRWRTAIAPVTFGLERVEVEVFFRQGASEDTLLFACLMSMR